MRCHGTQPREPWEYGLAVVAIYRRYAWLRHNLLDYIWLNAIEASQTGRPLLRALPLAFPGQAHLAGCDDAYLFGPDLLVAPMHNPGEHRPVPLPAGRWTDFWTGRVVTGGRVVTVPAPLDRIPVFLRAGALVPVRLNAALRWGESLTNDAVHALVVTPPAAPEARRWRLPDGPFELSSRLITGGFQIDLNGRPATRYLLVRGATVTAVRVNGEDLPHLTGAERTACPPGWYREPGRTIVRLPHDVYRCIGFRCAL